MTRVVLRPVGSDAVLVRLPRIFWLYRGFRAAFRKARPARRAWSWIVPGEAALARLGIWCAAVELRVARDLRRRKAARDEAEWEASAPVAIVVAAASLAQRGRNRRRVGLPA